MQIIFNVVQSFSNDNDPYKKEYKDQEESLLMQIIAYIHNSKTGRRNMSSIITIS